MSQDLTQDLWDFEARDKISSKGKSHPFPLSTTFPPPNPKFKLIRPPGERLKLRRQFINDSDLRDLAWTFVSNVPGGGCVLNSLVNVLQGAPTFDSVSVTVERQFKLGDKICKQKLVDYAKVCSLVRDIPPSERYLTRRDMREGALSSNLILRMCDQTWVLNHWKFPRLETNSFIKRKAIFEDLAMLPDGRYMIDWYSEDNSHILAMIIDNGETYVLDATLGYQNMCLCRPRGTMEEWPRASDACWLDIMEKSQALWIDKRGLTINVYQIDIICPPEKLYG